MAEFNWVAEPPAPPRPEDLKIAYYGRGIAYSQRVPPNDFVERALKAMALRNAGILARLVDGRQAAWDGAHPWRARWRRWRGRIWLVRSRLRLAWQALWYGGPED